MFSLERDAKQKGLLPKMVNVKDATKEKTTFIYSNRVVSTKGIDLQASSMTQRGVQAFFPEGELITKWRQEVVSRPVLPMDDF